MFPGENINYKDLYHNKICPQKDGCLPTYNGPPDEFVLYKLSFRASVHILGLTEEHKPGSPTIHVFGSIIMFSRAFVSGIFPLTTLFCAWLESSPFEVIFWERHVRDEIIIDINKNRFKNTMTVELNQKSIPDENNTTAVINSTENECNAAVIEEYSRNDLPKEEGKHCPGMSDNGDLVRMEVIKTYLLNEAFTSQCSFLVDDDLEADYSGTIHALRDIFDEVCPLGDALILARQNPWHNMNKTILNEFKSQWGKAIAVVKEEELDGYLPDSTWLQAMWLYVIGFPESVRTKRDVIFALFIAFSKLTSFSQDDIISALTIVGFRPSLSHWICYRCCLNSLKEDVLGVATYMSWNSYLCSVGGDVHYTYLDKDSDVSEYYPLPPVKVVLNIGNASREDINAVQLEMELEKWTPEDFVKSTFRKLQEMMVGKPESCYILGHCCPEQAIVSMAKSSMSPLATYRNKFSCGHGMYFFKLDREVLLRTFDELVGMEHTLNPLGLQFRAFLYAMLTVFQKPECDALSLSVLVFLTSSQFDTFDCSLKVLPLCNDDDPTGVKCSCKSPLSISTDGVLTVESLPLTTSAICTAISMIKEEDIEKRNAFALLGGIVDFHRISSGVYTSVIMDNNLEGVTDSFRNIPEWSTGSKYGVWKGLLEKNSSFFRRPTTSFNHMGGFSLSKPDRLLKNKPQHWSDCPLDPIREIVFVSSTTLSVLLAEAHQVSVVFLKPDDGFSTRSASTACFRTPAPLSIELTEEFCICAEDSSEDKPRHLYWKNRSRCRTMNCCSGKGLVSSHSSPSSIEGNPASEKKLKSTHKKPFESAQEICPRTQQELFHHYPEMKPAEACPVCEVKIGFHRRAPLSQSLSIASVSEGSALDGEI